MACDYHNRTDFRAFDVMVEAIINATPAELDAAIASCAEIGRGYIHTYCPMRRTLFKAFAAMLRLYKRKYA